jgi:CRP-like cAMP-binding protein
VDLKEKVRSMISNFDILNKKEIDLIVEKTIVDEFKKGTILLKQGQVPSKCYMVVEGCVREYLIKDGEEISTAFFTEGDTFTPPSLKGYPSNHYWECVEDCILTISNKNYEEEIRAAIPRLDSVFQEIAIEKINKSKEEWSQFVSSSPEERYLNLRDTKPHLLERIPHHQIASYLGIKPQSLSRIRKRILDQIK